VNACARFNPGALGACQRQVTWMRMQYKQEHSLRVVDTPTGEYYARDMMCMTTQRLLLASRRMGGRPTTEHSMHHRMRYSSSVEQNTTTNVQGTTQENRVRDYETKDASVAYRYACVVRYMLLQRSQGVSVELLHAGDCV
jgi:hypothetical protein